MTARYCLVLASLGISYFADHARADVLPFFSNKQVQVHVRFKNSHDYPEFDFYLKCSKNIHIHIQGGGRDLQKITSSQTIGLSSWGDLGTVRLVAVPRGQKLPVPEEVPDEPDWVNQQFPGTLQSKRLPGSEGLLGKADDGGEIDYRVTMDANTLTVELVEARLPASPGKWIALGCFIAFVVAVGLVIGLVVILRSLAKAPNVAR